MAGHSRGPVPDWSPARGEEWGRPCMQLLGLDINETGRRWQRERTTPDSANPGCYMHGGGLPITRKLSQRLFRLATAGSRSARSASCDPRPSPWQRRNWKALVSQRSIRWPPPIWNAPTPRAVIHSPVLGSGTCLESLLPQMGKRTAPRRSDMQSHAADPRGRCPLLEAGAKRHGR